MYTVEDVNAVKHQRSLSPLYHYFSPTAWLSSGRKVPMGVGNAKPPIEKWQPYPPGTLRLHAKEYPADALPDTIELGGQGPSVSLLLYRRLL